jgi:hypothetical protein
VEEQNIEIVCVQALEGTLDAGHNPGFGKVKAVGAAGLILEANAAFTLEVEALAKVRPFFQHLAEDLFGLAQHIDVGMIEEVDAGFQGGVNEGMGGLAVFGRYRGIVPTAAQAHGSGGEAADFRYKFLQWKWFHFGIYLLPLAAAL